MHDVLKTSGEYKEYLQRMLNEDTNLGDRYIGTGIKTFINIYNTQAKRKIMNNYDPPRPTTTRRMVMVVEVVIHLSHHLHRLPVVT